MTSSLTWLRFHTVTKMALRCSMNVIGCGLVASITAMGGGTVSNLLCGQTPVFWMREPAYLYLCLAVSAATFVGWPLLFEHSGALEAVGSSELIWWGAQTLPTSPRSLRSRTTCARAKSCVWLGRLFAFH